MDDKQEYATVILSIFHHFIDQRGGNLFLLVRCVAIVLATDQTTMDQVQWPNN